MFKDGLNATCLRCNTRYLDTTYNTCPKCGDPRYFPDTGIVVNEHGGKQSRIDTAFSLVPHRALLEVGKVMAEGAKRYEKDNWRKLTPEEIYDHAMEHMINWHLTGDMEELTHAMTRAMMLYEVALDDTKNKENS